MARWSQTLAAPLLLIASLFASAVAVADVTCRELTVFVRDGCPHCADAKAFLPTLQERHPGLVVDVLDVGADADARAAMAAIAERRRMQRPGVPMFVLCEQVLVGFEAEETTGRLLDDLLAGRANSAAERVAIDLPAFGAVSPGDLGLPIFTVAVGLVDGFNPCAMWVLLFLLSLLVHVRERRRIALIAGTFVLVSGLVYFAFMAAWLNIFLLLGYSRQLQLVLGVIALTVGAIHVKDFFALHRGVTLSIPETAKPGLYARMRRVVRAENLPAALAAIVTLALLVNAVELLCTAGLPALYTQVLTYYELADASYYGYLALYNLAYIFDDGLMVFIAVVTLGQHRLQERGGRWLKLLSGLVILLLGLAMLFAPGLLVF